MVDEQDLAGRVRQLEVTVATLQEQVARLSAAPPAVVAAVAVAPAAADERRDFEAHVGTYWLSRLGIVALITGVAFLITYHFGELGVFARVVVGYLLAGGLAGFGWWLSKRYALFGQILFGGGLAIAYFVTYALHFVPAVQVIDNKYLALGLLALVVVGIIAAAQRLQSETVAGIALFLGLHTSILSETSVLTLVSTTLLAAGALFFLVKNRWVVVPLSSLVAVYSSHITWATRVDAAASAMDPNQRLLVSLGFLVLYFVLFNFALLARPHGLSRRATLTFALLNWVGFVALGWRELARHDPEHLVTFLVGAAVALVIAAAIAWLRGAGLLVQTYLALASATFALTLYEQQSGAALVPGWAGLGVATVLGARMLGAEALRAVGFGVLVAGLVTSALVMTTDHWIDVALALAFIACERLRPPEGERRALSDGVTTLSSMGAAVALMRLVGTLMPSNLTTLAWTLAAFIVIAVGFVARQRSYRLTGLGMLGLAMGRLFLLDLAELPTDQRILTFILLGVVLLAISFAYTRLRGRLSEWL